MQKKTDKQEIGRMNLIASLKLAGKTPRNVAEDQDDLDLLEALIQLVAKFIVRGQIYHNVHGLPQGENPIVN